MEEAFIICYQLMMVNVANHVFTSMANQKLLLSDDEKTKTANIYHVNL